MPPVDPLLLSPLLNNIQLQFYVWESLLFTLAFHSPRLCQACCLLQIFTALLVALWVLVFLTSNSSISWIYHWKYLSFFKSICAPLRCPYDLVRTYPRPCLIWHPHLVILKRIMDHCGRSLFIFVLSDPLHHLHFDLDPSWCIFKEVYCVWVLQCFLLMRYHCDMCI